MSKKELKFILQQGEGLKIEFKESVGSIDKEIIAFANSNGGRIFLGVDDKGKVKGINITNKLKSQIQDIARNCDPQIRINLEEFEKVLIINVEEGKDKPCKCSSGFYLRQGANSQKMSRDEILDFAIGEGKIRFDEQINKEFNFPKDFSVKKLNDFLRLGDLSKALSREKILFNLGAVKKEKEKLLFNNAGVLFFAEEPQKFISWSVFTVALFKDKGGADIIDRKEITGSLFEIVEKVMDFVKLYAKVAYKFTGKPQRENIYEYPFEAIREAVINSVMHKDYFEHGHNNILKFFPDRIQIENIWIKPKRFILGETVFRRNKIIAKLFSRIHFGEKLGSGMERMKEYCRKEQAPFPRIRFTDTHFYIVFKPTRAYLKMAEKSIKDTIEDTIEDTIKLLSKNEKAALEEIKKDPQTTAEKLSYLLNINLRNTKNNISKLKQKGLLKRIGPARGGHWEIVEK